MPNRILRDGILRSKKIAQLHPMAELFYRRLMSVADDFGRYYADPDLLLSDCFPIRPSWADSESLSSWIEQCKACGLIQVYEVRSTLFLEIDNFGQRIKPGQSSKFPDFPGFSRQIPENPASRARSPSPPTPTPNTPPTANGEEEKKMIDGIFEEIYAAHPKKDGKVLAMQALAMACCPPVEDPLTKARAIQAKHTEWLPEFKRAGKFAPALHRWITDQKFLDDPPAPAEEEWDWKKAALGVKQ